MDKSHQQGQETRRRNAQARQERREREEAERAAQLAALRQIRQNPNATPETRLEAVKMIEELCKGVYDV